MNDLTDAGHLALKVSFGSATFRSQGTAEAVLKAFESFRDFYEAHQDEEPPSPVDGGSEEADPAPDQTTKAKATVDDFVPLSVFLDRKKLPRGNKVLVLGIAVWAKRYRQEDVYTADTLKGHWRDSKRKIPGNLNRDIGEAASEGWLERLASGQGQFGLTSYGENHFDGFPRADE